MGKECSEIDYFLHNLSTYSNKEVIDTIVESTSDHHPIRMVFKFEHKAYKNESKKCPEDREKNKMGKGGYKFIYVNGPNKYRTTTKSAH